MSQVPNPAANSHGDHPTLGATAASQGQKTGHMRWVLLFSTALAVAGLAAVWMVMAPLAH